jgi:hypothetical protein
MTAFNHRSALFDEGFKFLAESAAFECSVRQAIALSPPVREQLWVDARARTFSLRDVTAVGFIRHLLSDDEVSIIRSQAGLGPQLSSPSLELALAATARFDLTSFDLSVFSVEALHEVLGGRSFSIVSEVDPLERLLSIGDDCFPLLNRSKLDL